MKTILISYLLIKKTSQFVRVFVSLILRYIVFTPKEAESLVLEGKVVFPEER
jgi:hypothetical protein